MEIVWGDKHLLKARSCGVVEMNIHSSDGKERSFHFQIVLYTLSSFSVPKATVVTVTFNNSGHCILDKKESQIGEATQSGKLYYLEKFSRRSMPFKT